MTITPDAPLRVHYVASTGPQRGRATDRRYLNYSDGVKAWTAGETISQYGAVMRVGW